MRKINRAYTVATGLDKNTELTKYLDEYLPSYCKMERRVWQDIKTSDYEDKYPTDSKYVTYLCNKYGILKRTANSILRDVRGRQDALKTLKKTELGQLEWKIEALEDKIEKLKTELDKLKIKAVKNSMTANEQKSYKKHKTSLYWKKNKLNKLKQKYNNLEYQIENNILSLCFGTKKHFRKQYNLESNNYKSHAKWYNDFVKNRDKNIYFLGSSDETCGNQMCQLYYNKEKDNFVLKVRKEYAYCKENEDNYIYYRNLDFKYRKDDIIEALEAGKSLTYRFHKYKNRWRLMVMFKKSYECDRTRSTYGTIGLDFNDGFIELSETDEHGNLVFQKHYELQYHGTGNKAQTEMEKVISDIAKYAETKGKDVIAENLNFKKTKSKQLKGKTNGRKYNKMLHALDYSRYKKLLTNIGFNHHVKVVFINPKNTSKIGKKKYSKQRKLNIHQAASFVIARRGQGFIDTL